MPPDSSSPQPTLTKRLVRARAKIRDSGIPFAAPDRDRWPERLAQINAVVYLTFTQGYGADRATGTDRAEDLCEEAIWLGRQVHALVLMTTRQRACWPSCCCTHSRRAARLSADGALVRWADQDRGRWDTTLIEEARGLLASAERDRTASRPGPYALQAASPLLHTSTPADSEPDWALIVQLYEALAALTPSATVTVNRARALARAGRPDDALTLLTPLADDPHFRGYVPLHAVRADASHAAATLPMRAALWSLAARHAGSDAVRHALMGSNSTEPSQA